MGFATLIVFLFEYVCLWSILEFIYLIIYIRKQTATENFKMGTRGNAKKEKTQREMDRWSKTEHDKPWTDRRGY
jgi:hypothetical protein